MCPVTNLAMTWQRWCIIYLFIFKKYRHDYLKRLTNISFTGGPVPQEMLLLLITRLHCCFKAEEAKYMLWTLINLQSQGHFGMRWNSVAALCLWYLIFATFELCISMSSFFLLLSPAHWHSEAFARTHQSTTQRGLFMKAHRDSRKLKQTDMDWL